MKPFFTLLCLAIISVWSIVVLTSTPILTVTTNLKRGFEPLTVKAQVRLAPSVNNLTLCVGLLGEERENISCRDVYDDIRPTNFYEWKNVRAGNYVVTAQVSRRNAKPLQAAKAVEVLSTQ